MLLCNVDLQSMSRECGDCDKCSPTSKGTYLFQKDLANSNTLVKELMSLVERNSPFHCKVTDVNKAPDIRVFNDADKLVCRIEAKKLDDKPFMKVNQLLSGHDLQPKETIVVDLPKLQSYIEERHSEQHIPIFVVWQLHRQCRELNGVTVFQNIDELERIYQNHGQTRFYERRQGHGDIVDGKSLGITKKYHFSVRECLPIGELMAEINKL